METEELDGTIKMGMRKRALIRNIKMRTGGRGLLIFFHSFFLSEMGLRRKSRILLDQLLHKTGQRIEKKIKRGKKKKKNTKTSFRYFEIQCKQGRKKSPVCIFFNENDNIALVFSSPTAVEILIKQELGQLQKL